jgi:hypothetical protein
MRYIKQRNGRLYLLVLKGDSITNESIKDCLLFYTFSCPAFSEYQIRRLEPFEIESKCWENEAKQLDLLSVMW